MEQELDTRIRTVARDSEPRRGEAMLDRTPMEAAVGRLGDTVGKLEALMREHAERLAPILHPYTTGEEEGFAQADPVASDRVLQLDALADRVERLGAEIYSLTQRVEA